MLNAGVFLYYGNIFTSIFISDDRTRHRSHRSEGRDDRESSYKYTSPKSNGLDHSGSDGYGRDHPGQERSNRSNDEWYKSSKPDNDKRKLQQENEDPRYSGKFNNYMSYYNLGKSCICFGLVLML